MKKISIEKEGNAYTLYVNDQAFSNGFLEDMQETMNDIIDRYEKGESVESITRSYTEFY